MANQLGLFKRRSYNKLLATQALEPIVPTKDSIVVQTLPAFLAYLGSCGYSESTIEKYFIDVKKFSLFSNMKTLHEISSHDIEHWISEMVSPKGEHLSRKTVNRKVSAIINYFTWIMQIQVLEHNPAAYIQNRRIQSKLPDYLFENEIKAMYSESSKDPRIYLLVLLLLETGMKSSEILSLRASDIDISDRYTPELWIKHTGKDVKKDRKVSLPPQFIPAYEQYQKLYKIDEFLFPYTDRFIQLLFAQLKKRMHIQKELTPKTLRHTHVVRAYKRGENPDTIFERIGLAPDSRSEAHDLYLRLSAKGI